MKYLKKKEKKRKLLPLVLILVLVAAAAAVLLRKTTPEVVQTEPAPTQTTAPEVKETEPLFVMPEQTRPVEVVELTDGQIQTPYGVLYYPEGMADHLIIVNSAADPYTLEFYASMEGKMDLPLFEIELGDGSGGNMGLVQTSQGEVPFNATIYTLSFDETWSEGEILTAQAMQDVVNDMIDQLDPRKETARPDTAETFPESENTTVNYLEIVTPYCNLYYPARWGTVLRYDFDESEENVYKVRFYGRLEGRDVQQIFSIYFGGDEGDQLGAVLDADGIPVPVNILMHQLEVEGLTESEKEALFSMQEAANQLIEKIPFLK